MHLSDHVASSWREAGARVSPKDFHLGSDLRKGAQALILIEKETERTRF